MKDRIFLQRMIVFVAACLFLAACRSSGWRTTADLPTARWEHNTCVVDGKIYVIGGAGPEYQALDTVEVYDPTTNSWATKSAMPTKRQALSTSVVNGKIYAIGGAKSSSRDYMDTEIFPTVEEYDPASDTWTAKSAMPTARAWHSAIVVDGKIFIIGGSRGLTPGYSHVLTVEVYDPATDTWSQKADMPESRAAGSGSIVNGKIYLFGGYNGKERVDQYDPATDTWMVKSEMPSARTGLSTSVLDDKVYAIGGFLSGFTHYTGVTTVEVYDPATDTWTTAPEMPTGRYGAYSSVVDGKIYVFGGISGWPASALDKVEVYEPQKE